jgi:hypothetical protein
VPATSAPGSPARTLTPPQSASATSRSSKAGDVTPSQVRDSNGATPAAAVAPEPDERSVPEGSTTSTSRPAHRDDHPDDGRESDD